MALRLEAASGALPSLPSAGLSAPRPSARKVRVGFAFDARASASAVVAGLLLRRRSKVLRRAQAQDEGLQKLDSLLQRILQAELSSESVTVRMEAESQATKMLSELRGGPLRFFGTAERKAAKRSYSLQEMKDNGVDATQFLNPQDSTLDFVKTVLAGVLALGGAAFILAAKPGPGFVVFATLVSLTILFFDQVLNKGFGELLLLDTLGRSVSADYGQRVACHEAGHFLVAYLLGVMPKAYTLSAWEAFSKYNSMSTQAGTVFLDEAIQREMQSGQVSGKTLDSFVGVALGGIAAEYVTYGQANGGMSDIIQLEALFDALKFDQNQTNVLLRSSVM
ncbi:unnamed protein product, partial [Effrenium voratum]